MLPRIATCFCLILFLTAMPSLLVAQQASVDLPNTVSSTTCLTANNRNVPPAATLPTGPRLGLLIKALDAAGTALPNVKVNPPDVALAGCQLGETVAANSSNAIYTAAVTAGFTCTQNGGNVACGVSAAEGTQAIWAFRKATLASNCGFQIQKNPGSTTVTISADFDPSNGKICTPAAKNVQTNSGNDVVVDLLPRYLLQVNPNGFQGLVTIKVFHTQGGTNPRTGQVNTSSFGTDLTGLHTAIKGVLDAMNLGLTSKVCDVPVSQAQFPESFTTAGPLVLVSNAQTVVKFDVTGVPGQIITQETSVPATPAKGLPALSPWGVALLVGALLTTSIWMLRRRARLSEY